MLTKEETKEYNHSYREKHHEKLLERERRYKIEHHEYIVEDRHRYYIENLGKVTEAHLCYKTGHYYEHYYGISKKEYDRMLLAQDGKCAACGKSNSGHKKKNGEYAPIYVDHDHETGRVRGLLCNNCNAALGYAHDNPEILIGLVEYLQKVPLGDDLELEVDP